MVNSSWLFVGCCVTGYFGRRSKKRRTRERVTGTVNRAVDKHKWDVIFHFDGKLKKGISSRSLMIASGEEGISLTRFNVEDDSHESNGKEAEVRIWIKLNHIVSLLATYKVELFTKKSVPMFVNDEIDLTLERGDEYNDIFWRLWPASIDNDLSKLNE